MPSSHQQELRKWAVEQAQWCLQQTGEQADADKVVKFAATLEAYVTSEDAR